MFSSVMSDARPAKVQVTFHGRGLVPDQAWDMEAAARAGASHALRIKLPADIPAGRHMFTVTPAD